MERIIAILIFVLTLAGCATPDGDGAATAELADKASKLDAAEPTAEPEPAGKPEPRVIQVVDDGKRGTLVAWCGPSMLPDAARCFMHSQMNSEPVDLPSGNITHASLVLTWQAVSPLTEEMAFVVFAYYPNGSGEPLSPFVAGASPLTFDVDVTPPTGNAAEAGVALYSIPVERRQDPVVAAVASTDQPWHAEGTVTIQPQEASP